MTLQHEYNLTYDHRNRVHTEGDLRSFRLHKDLVRREVPGGATIQLGQMPMEKRGLPSIQATLVPILVELGKLGKDVAGGPRAS